MTLAAASSRSRSQSKRRGADKERQLPAPVGILSARDAREQQRAAARAQAAGLVNPFITIHL